MRNFLSILMAISIQIGMTMAESADVVLIENFGVKPDGSDSTPGVLAALQELRRGNGNTILFKPGRYHFWPDQAEERYLFVSNNDEGLKRIAFSLVGMRNVLIQGEDTTFVFHGPMVPFLIQDSHQVCLSGLSIDFVRPFHSEGKVLAITPETVDLQFDPQFPYEIRNGVLVFTNGSKSEVRATTVSSGEVVYPYTSLLAFDPVRREPAFMARDRYEVGAGIVAKELAPKQVRLSLDQVSAKPGDILVFGAPRLYPGIVVSESSQIHLDAVNIFHCGGMGVIAQMSSDLILRRVKVTPPEGSQRVVSITADATHFVNCRGKIEMTDCLFEQQKDDASNIHGLYARIQRIEAPNRMVVRMMHPQQAGIGIVKEGTRIELTRGPSLELLGYVTAKSVRRLNKETSLVETLGPLPENLRESDVIADADANTAEVLIRNCVIRNNRARGILLGSRGSTVVEGNTFHTPGSAILFEGDASFWFEQAGVRDVTIRGNTFDNCNYGVWGKACIQVGSGIKEEFQKTSRYNRNVVMENNLFRVFSPMPLLSIYSVDGIIFTNNRLEETNAYPRDVGSGRECFEVRYSDHLQIEEPRTVKQN